MTVEYRKLVDWNPREGDVFENRMGATAIAVSDTRAGFDRWEGRSEPFEWFGLEYRLVSRASDTERDSKPVDVRGDKSHTPLADMGLPTVEATVSGIYKEPATPKTWGEMTDEEKGALLLADHRGEVVQVYSPICDYKGDVSHYEWLPLQGGIFGKYAYRVRPEPKRETEHVTIVNSDGMVIGRGTVTTENGKPDCASIRMEELK